MTTLPTWAVYAISIGSPALAFAGALVAQFIARKGATELEVRSRREEVMRTLRWAAELAVSDAQDQARLGLAQLKALGESDMLDGQQQLFIDAALQAVVAEPVEQIDDAGPDNDRVAVIPIDGIADATPDPAPTRPAVPLTQDQGQEESR